MIPSKLIQSFQSAIELKCPLRNTLFKSNEQQRKSATTNSVKSTGTQTLNLIALNLEKQIRHDSHTS